MLVKVQDLKVGQKFRSVGSRMPFETVHSVSEFETGVMVFLESEVDNPFISSSFASYSLNTLLEVQ